MKLPFLKRRPSTEELERQAGEELEAAVARAKPPTEAERTWATPESAGDWRARAASLVEPPEVPQAPARPAARRGPLLPRVPANSQDDVGSLDDVVDEGEAPATRTRAASATPAKSSPKSPATSSTKPAATTGRAPRTTGKAASTAKRATGATKKPAKSAGSASRKAGPTRKG